MGRQQAEPVHICRQVAGSVGRFMGKGKQGNSNIYSRREEEEGQEKRTPATNRATGGRSQPTRRQKQHGAQKAWSHRQNPVQGTQAYIQSIHKYKEVYRYTVGEGIRLGNTDGIKLGIMAGGGVAQG